MSKKRGSYRSSMLIGSAVLAMLFAGCDTFSEPERFVDETVHPPEVRASTFDELQEGQHVGGPLRLRFDPSTVDFAVAEVRLAVDGDVRDYAGADDVSWELGIDTWNYPEGEHEISLLIYAEDSQQGLLTLAGAPAAVFVTRLVFDQTEPEPVAATINPTGTEAELAWEESTLANFRSYIVYRTDLQSGSYYHSLAPLDTIYERSTTTYTDRSLPEVYGREVGYEVRVFNGVEESSSDYGREPLRFSYGAALPVSENELFGTTYVDAERPVAHPVREEIYLVGPGGVFAIFAEDNTLLRHRTLGESSQDGQGAQLALDAGGEVLYVLHPVTQTLYVLDAQTFEERAAVLLPIDFDPYDRCGYGEYGCRVQVEMQAGPSGHVVIQSEENPGEEALWLIDAQSGDVATGIELNGDPGEKAFGSFATSPDGMRLYAVIYDVMDTGPEVLRVYDLAAPGTPIVAERTDLPLASMSRLQVTPDGTHLLARADHPNAVGLEFSLLNVATLEIENTLSAPGEGWIGDFFAVGESLFVTHSESGETIAARVRRYNLSTLEENGSWAFAQMPFLLTADAGGHLLIALPIDAFSGRSIAVDLDASR